MDCTFRKITVLLLFLESGMICKAQDGHYWTQQYGTRSKLLGGVVIGGVEDLGATYYNPARIAMTENPEFLLSSKVYELITTTTEEGIVEGERLSVSNFGAAPNLLAGSFNIKKLPDHRFAYSLLTRQNTDFGTIIRSGRSFDVLEQSLGDEFLAGEVTSSQKLNEEWIGLSWSYALNQRFSVGLTNYVVIRNQETAFRVLLEALNDQGITASAIRLNEFNYSTTSLLWKAGFAIDFSPFRAGLTVTTPRFQLSGNGDRFFDSFNSGGSIDNEGGWEDVLIANQQNDLDAEYNSPLSIGLGASYDIGRGKIHFSLEWFDKVDRFEVISPESFTGQSTNETFRLPVIEELESILNYGFGLEYTFTEKFSVYGGFTTDFTALPDEITGLGSFSDETNASIANWNLYHISGGASFTIKQKFDIVLGVANAFANKTIPILIDLPEDETSGPVFDRSETTNLNYSRWTFVLGFSIEIFGISFNS